MKRWAFNATFVLLLSLYKAFVLMHLWNWFVAPIFHISNVSLFQALGIFLIVAICTDHYAVLESEYWAKRILAVLDCCVPEDKKVDAKRALTDNEEQGWRDTGMAHFNELVNTTIVLVIGWGMHS